jgi:hypothetical protein
MGSSSRARARASADSRQLVNVYRDRFWAIWGTVSVNVASLASR